MSNTLNAYDALVRAAAHNGRLEAFTEVLAIVSVIADGGGDKATCARIVRAITAHQQRVVAGVVAEQVIERARQ